MSRSNSPKRRKSGKPHHERQVCAPAGRKIKHGSRKLALSAMNATIAKVTAGGARPAQRTVPNGVYRCEHCGDWHLTSKRRPQDA